VRLIFTLIFQEATKYLGIDISGASNYLGTDMFGSKYLISILPESRPGQRSIWKPVP
jgi:hypothetical protein